VAAECGMHTASPKALRLMSTSRTISTLRMYAYSTIYIIFILKLYIINLLKAIAINSIEYYRAIKSILQIIKAVQFARKESYLIIKRVHCHLNIKEVHDEHIDIPEISYVNKHS
jgi:hypothetical protein